MTAAQVVFSWGGVVWFSLRLAVRIASGMCVEKKCWRERMLQRNVLAHSCDTPCGGEVRHGGTSGFFARDMYEKTASAVRCDMVLHRAFRARHLQTNM